jgi:hypothetical protein
MSKMCSYKINKEFVVYEHMDVELTVINLREGHYFMGKGSAIDIFLMLEDAKTIDALIVQVRNIYSVQETVVRDELKSLIDMWLTNDLIAESDESPVVVSNSASELKQWTKPIFVAFDDMRDLLLLDPIHETDLDQQGWPVSDK